jgi:hypothetical protein
MPSKFPPYVQALLNPSTYPERPAAVELQQTQMSFIFLTGDYAYKTKKPVNLGYLDYTTLEKRERFCRQELELNRRLCPAAYLDVVPISESPDGIRLGGKGEVIEYAVKMKQLPRDRMMDLLLPQDAVTPAMLGQVAGLMADFHCRAATGPAINAYGSLEGVRTNTDENFDQTIKYTGTLITEKFHRLIREYNDQFLSGNTSLFNSRVSGGKIRDCHGDLHAAHVCFADEIYIYDCIEFNDRFRYCDTASEIAFLAMDIDRYGRGDLSGSFVQSYINASGDREMGALLDFYKCYRAYVRGKVACFKYDDPYLKDKKSIVEEAQLYFNLAYRYAYPRPVLIITTGLIGAGKTTAALAIGRGLGCSVLSSDVIRKELAGIPPSERHYEDFASGLYSLQSTQQTYNELFRRAGEQLKKGRSIVLDASFMKRSDRLAARQIAVKHGAAFLAVECVAPDETIRQRLEERSRAGSVSDGRWEIFADIKREYDPVTELSPDEHLILDTESASGNIIASLLQRINAL